MDTNRPSFVLAKLDDTNYTTLISDSHHHIIADEPYDKGGMDEGLTPRQLLASSLASCMAITIKMYTDRKGYAVEFIEVKVNHEQIYDQENPHFAARVTIKTDVDKTAREKIGIIAQKCPIHKLLHRAVEIETELFFV